MLFSDIFSTAMNGLKGNKIRSFLTTLGIIIGVGSVVLMVSMGTSFKAYILDQIEAFGANLIEVYPTGFEKFGQALDTISFGDYEAIAELSTVTSVAPVIFIEEKVMRGSEEVAPMIFGTTSNVFANYGFTLARGRLLNEKDQQGAKSVVVLGSEAATDLFDSRDPIGKRVSIGNRQYTVVGVLESFGSALMATMDEMVFVPLTIARAQTGQKYLDYISLQSIEDDELSVADITSVLRQRHQIDNPEDDVDKDDFRVQSAAQAADVVGTVTLGITLFLGIVAGISLLVGGIGIMNIMLVVVAERTKEIGLRKALGATRRDIMLQFLIEAAILTLLGGVIGIVGSSTMTFLLARIANAYLGDFNFMFSIPAVLIAFSTAAVTGIAFGMYPAIKAAELSPVEAMRKES